MASGTDERLERRRASNRASYYRNREKQLAKKKEWRLRNPERMKALNAKWYYENHERALAARKTYREANRTKVRLAIREWYRSNKDRVISTQRLQRTGCTPEKYRLLMEQQNGLCAICTRPPGKYGLAADHCHDKSVVRGLLCFKCNSLIGLAGDSTAILQAAIQYLS